MTLPSSSEETIGRGFQNLKSALAPGTFTGINIAVKDFRCKNGDVHNKPDLNGACAPVFIQGKATSVPFGLSSKN